MATSKSATKSSASGSRKTTTRSSSARKPTVRKASKLGRSRIPLNVVFESDPAARQAFDLLGISTIRELQKLGPDELIIRLTSPTKQTVGRIRKMLALNNRCLDGDERFALDIQKQKK